MQEADYRNLARVGVVSAVDKAKLRARVYYPYLDNLVSGWLSVLQTPRDVLIDADGSHAHDAATSVDAAGGHVHESAEPMDSAGGHGHDASTNIGEAGEHAHEARCEYWMPQVNDQVVVLHLPGFNTDGYILGVIM